MFSEWTDPNDIDNYYNDLEGMFKDVQVAPSSSSYFQPPVKAKIIAVPEAPTQSIIMEAAPQGPSEIQVTKETQARSPFVSHPTDQEPPERMCNGYTVSLIPDNWWIYGVVFVIFVFLVVIVFHQRSQLHGANMTLRMLMAMYQRVPLTKEATV